MRRCFRVALVSAIVLLSGCQNPPAADEPAISAPAGGAFSSTVRAQDDFYAYVNGPWIEANPIPSQYSDYGVFRVVFERTEAQIRNIIEDAAAAPADQRARQIGDLYTSFMDESAISAAGLTGLDDLFAMIDGLQNKRDVWRAFGALQGENVNVPVAFYTDADADEPTVQRLYLWQSGLGLPDRDYYLTDNEKLVEARNAYPAHIRNMYAIAALPAGDVAAPVILRIETDLANISWTRVQNRDRQKIYSNKFTTAEANALIGALKWEDFFAAAEMGEIDTFVLAQDSYFSALAGIVDKHDVDAWKHYLRFHVLKAFAPYLTGDLVDENFRFQGKQLRGQQELRPRWKRGVGFVNAAAGELLGQLYVDRHFPAAAKVKMQKLVEDLRQAFGESINDLPWMSETTKGEARAKLAAFSAKLGYPDEWRDYSGLKTGDRLLQNVRGANAFEYAHTIAKLTKPTDRGEWGMNPQTVNAYYRPTFNEIVFPAGILQPPFFALDADDASNYGAIGAVIGHEFSHGFDDQGRKFDGAGQLRDWWQDGDADQYQMLAGRLVEQYNQFSPLADVNINGSLTLGENIADLAGLTIAYRAYQNSLGGQPAPTIDGLSGDQRFFIAYARVWRGHYRDERLREILLTNPHSPGRYRVLGVLKNMTPFHAAFGVAPGDGMYLAPEERIRVW